MIKILKQAFSTTNNHSLKYILETSIIPAKKQKLKQLRKLHGDKVIAQVTVNQVLMGMKGIPALFYDGSSVDPKTDVRFRGHSIKEFCNKAEKALGGSEPLPESMFFLLTTGRYPTYEQLEDLSKELQKRSTFKTGQLQFIAQLPKNIHPMIMLSMTVLHQQCHSKFFKAYREGINKQQNWKFYFQDAMDLLAKLPRICAAIYRYKYNKGKIILPNPSLDWAGNFAHMLGFQDPQMRECLRGYMCMHSDHEGYNVSSHTCMLVGSALSDPYLSYSAAMNGLAGPLHGLANQQVLKWLIALKDYHDGGPPNQEIIEKFVLKTMQEGKLVPGYGHAVLKKVDARFEYFKHFAQRHITNDDLCDLAIECSNTIPRIMASIGKLKYPYPNVDAFSGTLLQHYGLTEYEFYTVCFGVSRAIGCLSNGIWARAFDLPMERPGSIDLNYIEKLRNKNVK